MRSLIKGGAQRKIALTLTGEKLRQITHACGVELTVRKTWAIPLDFYREEQRFKAVYRHKSDRKASEDNKPRIRRTTANLAPMEVVVMDVHHINVLVQRENGTTATPKLIAFHDIATDRVFCEIIMFEERGGVRKHCVEVFGQYWTCDGLLSCFDRKVTVHIPRYHGFSALRITDERGQEIGIAHADRPYEVLDERGAKESARRNSIRTLTPKHFAIIRVAKEQVGMSEGDYRALLSRLTGQETAKALTPQTFKKLMAHFEALGFISTEAKKNASRHPLKATEAQMRKISELWAIFTDGTGTETSLRHWMEKRGYGSSVGWLDGGTARRVIGALTKMVARRR